MQTQDILASNYKTDYKLELLLRKGLYQTAYNLICTLDGTASNIRMINSVTFQFNIKYVFIDGVWYTETTQDTPTTSEYLINLFLEWIKSPEKGRVAEMADNNGTSIKTMAHCIREGETMFAIKYPEKVVGMGCFTHLIIE